VLFRSLLCKAGLFDDLPYTGPLGIEMMKSIHPTQTLNGEITGDVGQALLDDPSSSSAFLSEFKEYADKLWSYVFELENRLYSEGLHVVGKKSTVDEVVSYMSAVLEGEGLEHETLVAIAEGSINSEPAQEIILRAQRVQKQAMTINAKNKNRGQQGAHNELVDTDNEDTIQVYNSGVRLEDLFTDEDKFGWSILFSVVSTDNDKTSTSGAGGTSLLSRLGDYLQYQTLRFQRDWGSLEAQEKLNELFTIGFESSDNNAKAVKPSAVKTALKLGQLLAANNDEELTSIIRAVGGEYVLPAPGGDIIRDGEAVLPTGRNIHALDPYRIPSAIALARGREAANKIVDAHRMNTGAYPETVAVTLWGLDTIKTKGESIGILLGLIGAVPVREATGRIVAFDLIPLETLGRPRIDVLASLSGIFRDSFGNVLDLLDNVFEKAATASEEPGNMNYIKMHTERMIAQGIDRPTSRLFSNPPGDYGSMVNEQVGSGDWDTGEQLGSTWESRNAYSYGSGSSNEKGVSRPQLLKALLNTTDRIVQEIDCVEYGLTDIQEYYANTGALKKAAENNRKGSGRGKVGVSIIEAFEKTVRPKELEDTLRLEYRSKLLNPKWTEAMLKQGSSGAYEISGRMTALIGWAGTCDYKDKWVFDGVADRYVLDAEVAKKLRDSNPEAFRNIVKRMLEANGRGFWTPDDDVIDVLKAAFEDIDDELEGMGEQ